MGLGSSVTVYFDGPFARAIAVKLWLVLGWSFEPWEVIQNIMDVSVSCVAVVHHHGGRYRWRPASPMAMRIFRVSVGLYL
jgi:hypothetical protein